MTAVIHHGPPGSFKSFGTIQRAVIPALKNGRTVVTNIRGLDSLERIENALSIKLPEEARLVYVDADSEKGFQAMRTFFHWVPKGALVALDETQRIWSKKRHRDLSKLDLKLVDAQENYRDEEQVLLDCPLWDGDYDRPHTVENAFDQHRHYNWDIYCTTPNISKVHPEIREIAEVAYRHRAQGALLPWWKNKWKEFTHDAETSGKSVSHYMGTPKPYKADVRIFDCYKSTKTGKAQGTSEGRPIYRDPKLQMVFVGIIACFAAFVYSLVQALDYSPMVKAVTDENIPVSVAGPGQVDVDDSGNGGSGSDRADRLENEFDRVDTEPQVFRALFEPDKPVQVQGYLRRYVDQGYTLRLGAIVERENKPLWVRVLVESPHGLIEELTEKELVELGYRIKNSPAGLLVGSESERYLLRLRGFMDMSGKARRDSAAMQAGFAGSA